MVLKNLKTEKGWTELTSCLFMVIMVALIVFAEIKFREIKMTGNYIDDGITLSGLAALICDVDETSENGTVIDKELTYLTFVESLKVNLDLTDDLAYRDQFFFSNIIIEEYIVYDVDTSTSAVTVSTYAADGTYTSVVHTNGNLCAPNGQFITNTSIYVKIGVNIKGVFNSDDMYGDIEKIVGIGEEIIEEGEEGENE